MLDTSKLERKCTEVGVQVPEVYDGCEPWFGWMGEDEGGRGFGESGKENLGPSLIGGEGGLGSWKFDACLKKSDHQYTVWHGTNFLVKGECCS